MPYTSDSLVRQLIIEQSADHLDSILFTLRNRCAPTDQNYFHSVAVIQPAALLCQNQTHCRNYQGTVAKTTQNKTHIARVKRKWNHMYVPRDQNTTESKQYTWCTYMMVNMVK